MVAWIEQGPAIPDVGTAGATSTSFTDSDGDSSTSVVSNASESQNQTAGEGSTEFNFTTKQSRLFGTSVESAFSEEGFSAGSTYAVDSNGTTISATSKRTAHWTPVDSDDPGSTEESGAESAVTAFTGTYDNWQTSCLSTSESTFNVAVDCVSMFTQLTVYSTTGVISLEGVGTVNTTLVITDTTEVEGSWMSLQSSTRSVEYLTTSEVSANTGGFFQRTVSAPDLCNTLWVATAPLYGISPLCEAFETSESFASDVDPFETTESSSADTASGEGFTEYGYRFKSDTDTETADDSATQGPMPLLGTYVIQTPAAIAGFQPYTALGISDPLYAAYTIHVATTVTDTLEAAARAEGATYLRGAITQVAPRNTADTLAMGAEIGGVTTVSEDVPHGGGYGVAPGDNTLRLFPGIYQLTEYDTAGGSRTARSSIADSTSFTFARGNVYAVEIMEAFTAGAPLPAILEQTC